jgi:DNA polymerase-3 subunit delta
MFAGQVYLVAGDESFLRDKAIEKIRLSFSKENSPLVFYSDDKGIKEVLDACRFKDMLAGNLLIIFKGFENVSIQDKGILSRYILNPNSSSCLILEASTRYIKGRKPYDKLPKLKVIECNRPQIRYLNNWISKLAKEKGKTIENEAVDSLIAKCGNNLKNLNDSIEKLSLYIGENKLITLKCVQELIGFDAEYTAYNLIDEIFKKNTEESLKIASRVISKEKDIFGLIGLISFQLTRLCKAQNMLANKVAHSEILNQLGIYHYLGDKFLKQAESFEARALSEAINILAETDFNFKTLPGDYRNNFDSLIVKLCAL